MGCLSNTVFRMLLRTASLCYDNVVHMMSQRNGFEGCGVLGVAGSLGSAYVRSSLWLEHRFSS